MLILLGDTRSKENIATCSLKGWGRMFLTSVPRPYPLERWGFDNGAYGAWLRGEKFPQTAFLRRLERAQQTSLKPYLAVCPDIVAGGLRSLDFSVLWRVSTKLPSAWPWYLAVQDGMAYEAVEKASYLFDGIFLGGTDEFKLKAFSWKELAARSGLKFHYGRAGTRRKLQHAHEIQADSLDSSFPLWTKERMKLFGLWVEGLGLQKRLEGI
jgi:hypothetical protein